MTCQAVTATTFEDVPLVVLVVVIVGMDGVWTVELWIMMMVLRMAGGRLMYPGRLLIMMQMMLVSMDA